MRLVAPDYRGISLREWQSQVNMVYAEIDKCTNKWDMKYKLKHIIDTGKVNSISIHNNLKEELRKIMEEIV